MMRWMKDAWIGWQSYITDGKLPALLLAVLLFYWFCLYKTRPGHGRNGTGDRHTLWIYTTVMTICCICPVTAAVLMQYQTKFYDYQWIWNAVPFTIVIALGATLIWERYSKPGKVNSGKNSSGRNSFGQNSLRNFGLLLLLILPILLAGGLETQPASSKADTQTWIQGGGGLTRLEGRVEGSLEQGGSSQTQGEITTAQMQNLENLLSILREQFADSQPVGNQPTDSQLTDEQNSPVILWAPKDVMEMARSLDGSITLVYGRNMWDPALNAYSYDTYGPEQEALYQWMCELEESGEPMYPVENCIEYLKYMNVNTLVLPGTVTQELLSEMEQALGVPAGQAGDYYYFVL